MSMFDTTGKAEGRAGRKPNTLKKLDRLNTVLRHEEPDRVPISDFFWGSFTKRWREELGLPADANPYYHYDLDWIVTVPNMDPWIRPFETIRETSDEVVVRTGFGQIANTPRGLLLADLGSSNGTYHNSQRLSTGWVQLGTGDQGVS